MNEIYNDIAKLSPEKRKLLEKILAQQNVDLNKNRILPTSRDRNEFPLSYAQQRMWFLDQLEPGNPMYNNPAAISIKGRVDVDAIEKSLMALTDRHEVLRTVFASINGRPVQVIQEESTVTLEKMDWSDLGDEEKKSRLAEEASRAAQAPFNLKTGPLMRTRLIKMNHDEYVFLLTMHHIISDAWTLTIFIREFAALYQGFVDGNPVSFDELPIQYVDYASWQREYLQGDVLKKQLDYWKNQLAGGEGALDLPTDHSRPKIQTHNGDVIYYAVDAETTRALEVVSKEHDVTLFMTLLAALSVLLYRYSGQTDISIGTPIANRNRSEVEPLLGVFVNTLVMRNELAGDLAFSDFVKRVKETTLGAYDHQDIPFEMIVEELKPERDMSRPPFFQTMFVMQNAPTEPLKLPNATIQPLELHTPTAKFDLTFVLEPKDDKLDGQIIYNTDLFDAESIDRMVGHIKSLLKNIGAQADSPIDDLAILTPDEQNILLEKQNQQTQEPVDIQLDVCRYFEKQVETHSNSTITCSVHNVTFSEFNARANQLARRLIELGAGRESIVGIYVERSVDLLMSMMAVLKTGAAFLPLDPDYPQDRLEYMLDDSHCAIVISQSALAESLPGKNINFVVLDEAEKLDQLDTSNVITEILPEQTAYVIYTSGSTGKPKGVLIPHAAFVQHMLGMQNYFELTESDHVLQFASTNFDAALEQIFPTLLAGAHLYMRDKNVWSPEELSSIIKEQKLTVINLPTAYWNQCVKVWASEGEVDSCVRLVIIGGDLMSTDSLTPWQQSALRNARLLNAYGPTETTITATAFDIPTAWPDVLNAGAIPIGRPLLQRSAFILDSKGNPVPVGVPGELCIGGFALARGYLARPDLTAERFVPNPFFGSGERLYKTGDLVRLNNRGDIEFLGRVDQQVKIRGYRIELGEIAARLNEFPGIKNGIVMARDTGSAEKVLVAYYELKGDEEPSVKSLRDYLQKSLPDYMTPGAFMHLEKLPMTPGGKVDRKALPEPEVLRPKVETEYVAPRTETEARLAEIMASVLKIDKVGVFDNFFELGGHSMMGTQIVSQLREEYLVELPLRTLFENPTVDGIARAITEEQASQIDEDELADMLSELDGLADDELQQMLNDE